MVPGRHFAQQQGGYNAVFVPGVVADHVAVGFFKGQNVLIFALRFQLRHLFRHEFEAGKGVEAGGPVGLGDLFRQGGGDDGLDQGGVGRQNALLSAHGEDVVQQQGAGAVA